MSIGGKDIFVNQVLEVLAGHAPWTLNGYTAELEKTWTKNRPSYQVAKLYYLLRGYGDRAMQILEKDGRFSTAIDPFLSSATLRTIVTRGSYLFGWAWGSQGRPRGLCGAGGIRHHERAE
jgi:hypothetical protein